MLECWLCGTRWRIARIRCPYCGNKSQDKLGFFTVEDNKLCRVYFCTKCNKYHKVFDIRAYDESDALLPIHNLASLAFDRLAVKEGFEPGSGLQWVNKKELD